MSQPLNAQAPAEFPALRLKRNEDRRLSAGHLWIFSNEVDTDQTPLVKFAPGDLVRVMTHNDRPLGLAYVNPRSLICARLLSTWVLPTADWFATRFRAALVLRERLYATPHYRLVFGESDGLPGLVIDRFGETLVVQIGTAGMERLKEEILAGLDLVLAPRAVLFKNDGGARELEGLPSYVEDGKGQCPDDGVVVEDGLEFSVPLRGGQKTGWYFDQAANRRAMAKYLFKGARVLDLFSYVGAWGVRAARGAAAEVLCVDASAPALELAEANAKRNGLRCATEQGDAFDVLDALIARGLKFDVIVADPPAFAKRKKDLPKAIGAYKRLNQLAMRLLNDNGILVSCSCSQHLAPSDLEDAISKAGRGANAQVQLLEIGGQAPDHPVHAAMRETRYLKAYFCRVQPAWFQAGR
jgi:23S rRNA (cytosine1962-C5)-methyltransferase